MRVRSSRLLAALAVGVAIAAQTPESAAAGERFVTARGAAVATPPVEGLDCGDMRAVLDAIDATGYREGGPKPRDPADMALFEYEDRLSRAFYGGCVTSEAREADAEPTFRTGFGPEPQR